MARLIAVFNNKGGVGKTILCWNIADTFARRGKRVLLMDFDPQCNLSIAVLGEDLFCQTTADRECTIRHYTPCILAAVLTEYWR